MLHFPNYPSPTPLPTQPHPIFSGISSSRYYPSLYCTTHTQPHPIFSGISSSLLSLTLSTPPPHPTPLPTPLFSLLLNLLFCTFFLSSIMQISILWFLVSTTHMLIFVLWFSNPGKHCIWNPPTPYLHSNNPHPNTQPQHMPQHRMDHTPTPHQPTAQTKPTP